MPIHHNLKLRRYSEDEFHALDYEAMALLFAIHKKLGRFCDEKIYQAEFAHRCREKGFGFVGTEIPVRISYRDFSKTYFLDVFLNEGGLYELKTAAAIAQEHRMQTLHYLMLLDLFHGKLVNMRTPSVQHEFVSTRLTAEARHHFSTDKTRWQDLSSDGAWLHHVVTELVGDWGAFLDVELFYEAIQFFRGGEGKFIGEIELVNGSRVLGKQRARLLDPLTAIKLSAVAGNTAPFEEHLRRFLAHTSLRAIQWINFNHHRIEFRTLLR